MVNPAIQIIAPDDEGMIALLDESNSLITEGNTLEAELLQGEEGDVSWFQKFTGKLKTELDNCSDIVKEKIIDMKVRMSSKMESELEAKDAQQHSQRETRGKRNITLGTQIKDSETFDKVFKDQNSDQYKVHFRTNILIGVTRRVQKLAANHGIALEFLQVLINKLETRLSDVEAKVAAADMEIEKHYGFVKNEVKVAMDDMNKKFDILQKEKEELEAEVDKTRQWGMKGNIIISTKKENQGMLEPITEAGRKESITDVSRRIIQQKTGVEIKEEDILACHSFGREGQKSVIVKIHNHKVSSGWESLTAGMVSGKHKDGNFVNNGVFLNFQLTEHRKEIHRHVREARKQNQIKKFKVDANGRIFVTLEKGKKGDYTPLKYTEVTSVKQLVELLPDLVLPVPRVVRQQEARQ